jgi:arylsulfatase A-like enzyme
MQPSRIGVYWNPDMGAVRLPQGHALLPEALKAAGYRTGIVGKWNLSNPSWDPMPVLRYFDQAYDTMVWEGDYWPDASGNYHGVEDGKYGSSKTNAIWGPIHDGDEYLTDRLTRHACTFIAQDAEEEPFFLYLAYNAPHSPLQGRADHLPLLSAIESEAQRLYASMVLAVDEGVGQVVRELERQKIMENTLVLFISDNGPAVTSFKGLPEHWPRDEMLGSTGGLNGKKGTYFEGGIRVPFILHWPAQVEDAFVYDSPVTTLDLFPTLCAIAGTKPSAKTRLDGVNLVPFLLPNQSTLPDRTLLWFSGPSGAVRRGDWKLLFDQDSAPQLYNLEQDPKETMDLAEDESVVVKELSAVVREWRQQVPPPVTPRENLKKKASP